MPAIEPPLIPTPIEMVESAIEKLQAQYPAWQPNPASPEYQMFLAFAYICAQTIVLAYNVPEAIVRFVGEVVYQTPPEPGVAAQATSTWTAIDTAGHTIPAGTVVLVTPEGGEPIAFETTEPISIPPGSGATAVGEVALRAVEPGAEGNINVASTVFPNELISWVKEIALVELPSGGQEEESEEEYAKRITELATIVKPEPILPEDFANFIRLMIPGLRGGRVLAIDLLKLKTNFEAEETGEPGVERCVTVIPILADGTTPPTKMLEEAGELLESKREINFKSFVGKPNRHPINVVVKGTSLEGFTETDVAARTQAAVEEFLDPKTWGKPPQGSAATWINQKVLRRQDLITVLNNVEGFGHYTELKINGEEKEENTLTGLAPLPEPGSITVTIEASNE